MRRLLLAGAIAAATATAPAYAQAPLAQVPLAQASRVQPPLASGTPQSLASVPLTIRTRHRQLRYQVELARSPLEQEIGLMFRRSMPARHGMIFPMKPPRPASFWMKNTLIPLDLVFIRADGTISSIAANAPPLSLATIDSHEPVAAVLELVGGAAARAGIRAGDRVRW